MRRVFFSKDTFFNEPSNNSLSWKYDREFLFSLKFSEMALLSSCLANTPYWNSAWDGDFTDKQKEAREDLLDDLQAKLRGEPVDTIAEKLEAINNTLGEMRDKMGSGNGDGEGNTIQDLIFWIKLLFALTTSTPPAGLAPASVTTEPYLSLINDKLAGLGLIMGLQTASLEEIRAELEGIKEKECPSPSFSLPPVYIPQEIADNAMDLLRNGSWQTGRQVNTLFVADNWAYDSEEFDSPGRQLISGVYHLNFIQETQATISQTVRVPPGYGNVLLRIDNRNMEGLEGMTVEVDLSGSLIESIQLTGDNYEKSLYGNGGESLTIRLFCHDTSGFIGTVELLAFPVGLTTKTQVLGIGGQRGKGKITADRLVKDEWTVIEDTGSGLTDWVVEKLDATRDWLVMRLTGEGGALGLSSLLAAKEYRLDFGTKIATVSFNMSRDEGGNSSVQLEYLDASSEWILANTAQTDGKHVFKIDFPNIFGEEHESYNKIIRVVFNGYKESEQNKDFFIYDLEIEESD